MPDAVACAASKSHAHLDGYRDPLTDCNGDINVYTNPDSDPDDYTVSISYRHIHVDAYVNTFFNAHSHSYRLPKIYTNRDTHARTIACHLVDSRAVSGAGCRSRFGAYGDGFDSGAR